MNNRIKISLTTGEKNLNRKTKYIEYSPLYIIPHDHLLLDSAPNKLDHSYLVGNLTNSKIAETKALEPLKS
jgi:hypothetical protein